MADEDDFTLSADTLSALVTDFEDLAAEQQEAQAARSRRDQVARRVAQDRLQLAKETRKQFAQSSARQAELIDDMEGSVERIEEINESPFLQIVEPIAGLFNPEFSRSKLAANLANDSRALQLEESRNRLVQSGVERREAELESQLGVAQAEFAQEVGDVTSLQEAIELTKTAITDTETIRNQLLVSVNDDELPKLVQQGIATERQVQDEQRARQSEESQLRTQRINEQLTEFRLTEAKLSKATIEQLRDPEFVRRNNFSAGQVRQEIQRKATRDLAFDQQVLTTQRLREAERLDELKNEQLEAIAAGEAEDDLIAGPEAEAELQARKERAARTSSSAARASREADAALESQRNLVLTTALLPELEDAINNAEGGFAVFKRERDGAEVRVPLPQVRKQAQLLRQATAETAIERSVAVRGQKAAQSALDEMLFTEGLTPVDDATIPATISEIVANGDLPAEDAEALQRAGQQLDQVQRGAVTNVQAAFQMQERALNAIREVRDRQVERMLAGKPKAQQAAMKRMINAKGVVKTQSDAVELITPRALTDVQTLLPHYNSALEVLRTEALATGVESKSTEDQATALAREFTLKDLSATERIAQSAINPGLQEKIARPILSTIAVESYAQAASQLGSRGLAKAIRSGAAFPNGSINEEDLARFVLQNQQELGVRFDEFSDKVIEIVGDVAERLSVPEGAIEEKSAIAAVNKLLFNNRVREIARNRIGGGLETAIVRVQQQRAQRPRASDPLGIGFRSTEQLRTLNSVSDPTTRTQVR